MKPKLTYLGDGKWINPSYITTVSDDRVDNIGTVTISTLMGGFYWNCPSEISKQENDAANTALSVLGLDKDAYTIK